MWAATRGRPRWRAWLIAHGGADEGNEGLAVVVDGEVSEREVVGGLVVGVPAEGEVVGADGRAAEGEVGAAGSEEGLERLFARGRVEGLKRLPSEVVEATAKTVDGLVRGAAVQLNGCRGGGLRCGNLRSRRLRGGRSRFNRHLLPWRGLRAGYPAERCGGGRILCMNGRCGEKEASEKSVRPKVHPLHLLRPRDGVDWRLRVELMRNRQRFRPTIIRATSISYAGGFDTRERARRCAEGRDLRARDASRAMLPSAAAIHGANVRLSERIQMVSCCKNNFAEVTIFLDTEFHQNYTFVSCMLRSCSIVVLSIGE